MYMGDSMGLFLCRGYEYVIVIPSGYLSIAISTQEGPASGNWQGPASGNSSGDSRGRAAYIATLSYHIISAHRFSLLCHGIT
jgi:hypothetical protein